MESPKKAKPFKIKYNLKFENQLKENVPMNPGRRISKMSKYAKLPVTRIAIIARVMLFRWKNRVTQQTKRKLMSANTVTR